MEREVPLEEVEGGVIVRATEEELVVVKDGKLYKVYPQIQEYYEETDDKEYRDIDVFLEAEVME